MNLKEYFTKNEGTGVFSTSDGNGNVNSAIYARPHVIDERTVAFIMGKHKSYENILLNPHAHYLFTEDGNHYEGARLSLTKIKEVVDKGIIDDFRKARSAEIFNRYKDLDATLVYFSVNEIRPLIGDGKGVN